MPCPHRASAVAFARGGAVGVKALISMLLFIQGQLYMGISHLSPKYIEVAEKSAADMEDGMIAAVKAAMSTLSKGDTASGSSHSIRPHDVTSELATLKLSQLRQRALDDDCHADKVNEAFDSENPRAALAELIHAEVGMREDEGEGATYHDGVSHLEMQSECGTQDGTGNKCVAWYFAEAEIPQLQTWQDAKNMIYQDCAERAHYNTALCSAGLGEIFRPSGHVQQSHCPFNPGVDFCRALDDVMKVHFDNVKDHLGAVIGAASFAMVTESDSAGDHKTDGSGLWNLAMPGVPKFDPVSGNPIDFDLIWNTNRTTFVQILTGLETEAGEILDQRAELRHELEAQQQGKSTEAGRMLVEQWRKTGCKHSAKTGSSSRYTWKR